MRVWCECDVSVHVEPNLDVILFHECGYDSVQRSLTPRNEIRMSDK